MIVMLVGLNMLLANILDEAKKYPSSCGYTTDKFMGYPIAHDITI